ncbi:unnamed protein product, partial [Dicrocoelium dendriticum]
MSCCKTIGTLSKIGDSMSGPLALPERRCFSRLFTVALAAGRSVLAEPRTWAQKDSGAVELLHSQNSRFHLSTSTSKYGERQVSTLSVCSILQSSRQLPSQRTDWIYALIKWCGCFLLQP